MIWEDLRSPRDNGPGLFAGGVGLLLGILLGVLFIPPKEAPAPAPAPLPVPTTGTARGNGDSPKNITGAAGVPQDQIDQLQEALDDAAAKSSANGRLIAAAWPLDWESPILTSGDSERMRMWSMSKPVVALSALEAATRSGSPPSPEMMQAIDDALTMSDNCAIRRVTLGLQELSGDGVEGAEQEFDQVLGYAGVKPPKGIQHEVDSECQDYLVAHQGGLSDPSADAALFGTAEWTIGDAVAFVHALGFGRYGLEGKKVLREMRKPKSHAETVSADSQTFDPNFGAGNALGDWDPAYKGGWGGSNETEPSDYPYLVGQIVVLEDPAVALAAVFLPDEVPPNADPGTTVGPDRLEEFFGAIRPALEQLKQGSAESASGSR